MAECICPWVADRRYATDPACPVHGFPPREPGAYHDGRKDNVPAPGEGDELPNPEMEVEC